MELTAATLRSWEFVVEVGDHAMDQWGYMAGRDADRAADLNDAFHDPGVRAVVASRGGAGAYRIVDDIDVEVVRRDPKPLVGFSDITHLHLALWHRCRVATIHGCVVGRRAQESVRRLLTTGTSTTLVADPVALTAQMTVPGHAEGTLVGGNLTAVAGEVGTGLLDLDGCLLLLENFRSVGLGRVDRQLTQLLRSGALDGVRGVVLGRFAGFEGYVDRQWDLLNVLRDRLTALDVPVLGGFDIGHSADDSGDFDQDAVALGTTAVLDTEEGTLTSEPCVR